MARYLFLLISLLLFTASMLSVFGFRVEPRQAAQPTLHAKAWKTCRVLIVFDGDTFGCDINGNGRIESPVEHVRMLGMDATEMHYSRKNRTGRDEPYAVEAKQWVESHMLKRPVYLESDIKQRDKYNRILAYVYLDPQRQQMANALLVQEGLAHVLFIGENRRYESRFYRFEREARQARRRLWKR
jgi:micrococcal nuclease